MRLKEFWMWLNQHSSSKFCRHHIISFVLFLLGFCHLYPFVHENLSKNDVCNLSGDVPWRDWRNFGCNWTNTVCQNSGTSLQTNFKMCFQSPLSGKDLWCCNQMCLLETVLVSTLLCVHGLCESECGVEQSRGFYASVCIVASLLCK